MGQVDSKDVALQKRTGLAAGTVVDDDADDTDEETYAERFLPVHKDATV
jgi:hypothetical protein